MSKNKKLTEVKYEKKTFSCQQCPLPPPIPHLDVKYF